MLIDRCTNKPFPRHFPALCAVGNFYMICMIKFRYIFYGQYSSSRRRLYFDTEKISVFILTYTAGHMDNIQTMAWVSSQRVHLSLCITSILQKVIQIHRPGLFQVAVDGAEYITDTCASIQRLWPSAGMLI